MDFAFSPEDERFRRRNALEKTVTEGNKNIDAAGAQKEREILAG